MKKILITIFVVIMMFSMIGCEKKVETVKTTDEKYANAEGIVEEPPIHVEEVPVTFIDENNTVKATFVNNTDKDITSYKVTGTVKSTGKKIYFDSDNKVNSKKTSDKIEPRDSIETNKDDIEIIRYEFGFTDEKGLDRIVQYSCSTKKYILI
ncbi:hypothetical protein [Clostridium sp. C2-6-12]|uniref:hypothetical protein n=1 Tax=Clostridium sp. C2-6-12 TaxID=2698832 RepID=UPI00136DCC25|nr:hypothetical protein [Clostridium sp. C2-6-12]